MNDRDRIRALIEALAPGTPDLRGAILDGEPHPQGRPRVDRRSGRIHKLGVDLRAERATAGRLRQSWPAPLQGNLVVVCIFYRSTLRTVDLDNLEKHLWDAGKGVVWADDRQITGDANVLEMDREHPRTVVAVCRHESTMWRGPRGGNRNQPDLLQVEPQLL